MIHKVFVNLAIFISLCLASCPASISQSPGPAYLPNAPLVKEDICPYDQGPHRRATIPESCSPNSYCWRYGHVPSYRVKVEGLVREADTCKPISNASIELWTTDSNGQYSYFFDVPDHKGCFGTVLSKKDGDYSFVTWRPGSYGFDAGFLPFAIPPLVPQHIHVAVYSPGYKLYISQLYFEDDPAREGDLREWIANVSLGAKIKELQLHLVDSGMYNGVPLKTAKFDFGLVKDEKGLSQFDQWNWYCLNDFPTPFGFCNPKAYEMFAKYGPKVFVASLLIFTIGFGYLGKICLFGRKKVRREPKKKSE